MMLNLLKRRIPISDPMCSLCGCEEETTLDLFYQYNINRSTLFVVLQIGVGIGRTDIKQAFDKVYPTNLLSDLLDELGHVHGLDINF